MISVEVEDDAWTRAVPDVEVLTRRAAEQALRFAANRSPVGAEDVSVLLADDAAVRDLNARFRGKPQATNVLAFPAAASARPHLGDIALAYGVCAREAGEQGKPLDNHLMHLVVHGILHLLGYDHLGDGEAQAMETMERNILAGLGRPDPYAAGGGDARS